MVERFDANRDGQLDDQERGAMLAAKAERRAQMKQRFDANRDGQLDGREKQQAKTAMRVMRMERRAKRFQRLIERFDRDQDGSLGPGEVPPKAMHRLQRLDRDGDGWVRPNEMRMRPRRGDARPSQAPGASRGPAGDY
jgi:Ca2+-binding EF-hand superfamily protein